MIGFRRILLAAFFSLSMFGSKKPNVLFIAIDDLNDWVGVMGGHEQTFTPNIDALANRGTLFANAHCAAPACNPSRVSLLSGMSPVNSGVYYNNQDWRLNKKLEKTTTLPKFFKENGYAVYGGGKIYHAASLSEKHYTGLFDAVAWDEYFPSKKKQMPYETHPERIPMNGSKRFYKGYFDWSSLDIDDSEMADAKVVSWAERHLSKKHEQPLFLAVGIYRPHIPWYTPKSYFDKIKNVKLPKIKENDLDDIPKIGVDMSRRSWHSWMTAKKGRWQEAVHAYLASVSFTDAMVGRLIKALDNGPMAGNTIIVLWSDHGYHLGHKEHWEKFTLWEQATRVPLIFVAPGMVSQKPSTIPASLLDVYPTLADLCGLKEPEHLDGMSLKAWLQNSQIESSRNVIITQGKDNHAVRSRHWRYIQYEDGSEELYDLRKDPEEFINLANDQKYDEVKAELVHSLPSYKAPVDPPQGSYHKKINE